MKKIFTSLLFATVILSVTKAQNTFPPTGRAGIYTTSPVTSLQVKGGARIGTTANYINIDSATGKLTFAGTGAYLVGGNKYAFQYTGSPNYGLFFNSTNVQYEFRDGNALPVFSINANTGNSVFKGALQIGAYTLPVTDGTNGQVLKTNGTGALSWSADNNNIYSPGTGISIVASAITNTAPDQTVVLTAGTAISVAGTYPNFTVTNSLPDKTVVLSNGTGISVTGTYPNFTVTNASPDKTVALTAGTGISVTGTYPNFTIGNTIPKGWSLTGNAGTDSSLNFLGTTDAHPLVFRVNNLRSGLIDNHTSNTSFGYRALIANTTGDFNTATGTLALFSNSTGFSNTAAGSYALVSNSTGGFNVAIGSDALHNNNGSNNTATGASALYSNTTGIGNVATGTNALNSNVTGNYNTATGTYALQLNTGSENTANGTSSLHDNTTGQDNTASGFAALNKNNTGINNSANGAYALYSNTTGQQNTATGDASLYSNVNGNYNAAHGNAALNSNIDGLWNTANGAYAMYLNTHGGYNTATGGNALYSNTTGINNTANGYSALYSNATGVSNTATGFAALNKNISGANNTATGSYALWINTGDQNTATGSYALQFNTTGTNNVANGYQALNANISGNNNTATGYHALYTNSTGRENTATGFKALMSNTTGIRNTANGDSALMSNISGYQNVAVGYDALTVNDVGHNNVAVGYGALSANYSGYYNTAIGALALYYNTTGIANTGIGFGATALNTDGSDAHLVNWTGIGYVCGNSQATSNMVVLGNPYVEWIGGQVGWSTYSDARIKENVKQNVPGLAFINLLRPVTYHLNIHHENDILNKNRTDTLSWDEKYNNEKKLMTGFVAQDVEKAANSINYDFSGIVKPKNSNQLYSLRYSEFVVPLVKAVQELSSQNDSLMHQNTAQQKINADMQKQMNLILQKLSELEAKQNACSPCANAAVNNNSAVVADGSLLEQNIPNPFTNTTSIGYTLPQKFLKAQIIITDKNGKTLLIKNVSGSGKGRLTVDASVLASGAYNYSLYIDGKLIETKQMILQK